MWSIRQALSSNLLTQLLGTKVLITHLAIVWHVHPIKSTLHQLNKKRRNLTYSSIIDQLSALKLYYISLHFLHKVKTMFSCDEEPDALWYFSPFIIWDLNRFLLNNYTYHYWKLKQSTNCETLLFDACLLRCNTTSNQIDQDFNIHLNCMHWTLSIVLINASVVSWKNHFKKCLFTINLLQNSHER